MSRKTQSSRGDVTCRGSEEAPPDAAREVLAVTKGHNGVYFKLAAELFDDLCRHSGVQFVVDADKMELVAEIDFADEDVMAIVKMRAVPEHKGCALDWSTGEVLCTHHRIDPPRDDCRQPYCPHRDVMRERVEKRLRKAYALGTVIHVEV